VSRTLFARNVRHHALLLAAIWLGVFLFELFLVWVVAQLDAGGGLQTFLTALVPPEMQEVLFEQFGLASFPGGVAFGFQHPFTLVGGIAFLVVAATVPAAERESGFLDLVLARPVPRSRYLAATVALVVLGALAMAAASLAGAAAGLAAVEGHDDVAWVSYLPSAAALACLYLAVGGYSLLFATDSPRRGPAATRAVGVTLLFYWLDFMGGFWDLLETARWLSPFSYFDPGAAVRGTLGWRDPGVLLVVATLCVVGSFLNFRRQEL
jgi:ABC-2 type transport system permease protein